MPRWIAGNRGVKPLLLNARIMGLTEPQQNLITGCSREEDLSHPVRSRRGRLS